MAILELSCHREIVSSLGGLDAHISCLVLVFTEDPISLALRIYTWRVQPSLAHSCGAILTLLWYKMWPTEFCIIKKIQDTSVSKLEWTIVSFW